MQLSELKQLHVSQLLEMAEADGIENANRMRKQELIFALLKKKAKNGESIYGDGVLEILPDGFGFLRSPDTSYLSNPDDIYISPSQIRRFNLHTGDTIEGEIRTPKDGERYFALTKIDKANGGPVEGAQAQDPVREPDAPVPQPAVQAGTRHQGGREHDRPRHRHHLPHRQGLSAASSSRRRRPARR
jgi:transcription termination factor Rho